MATKTKAWSTGTGSVTIQYGGQGDCQIIINSDANNLYEARSMQITVKTTSGSPQQTKTITINQAAKVRIDISNAIVTASNQTYNGSAKTPTPTVTLNGTTIPSTGYDVLYSDNTNAGTATITVVGKGDYTGTATGTFIINKAAPSYTAPAKRKGLTYNGDSQYLTTKGSTNHGTIYYSTDGSNWYTSRRTGTNAGTYSNYWKLIGDLNHTDISSTSIGSTTIAKASRSLYWSSYPSSLDVGDSDSLSAYPSAGSGDGSISYSSSNNSVASVSGNTVYGNSIGSCTIYASISEGTNYLSASTSYTITVNESADLQLIKSVLESKYNEHVRYAGYTIDPSTPSLNRNSVGGIYSSSFNNVPFIVTPKSGCKIVPVQTNGSGTGRYPFVWTTNSEDFDYFYSYPYIGLNLSYTDDRNIPTGTSLWDFIEVSLL